MAYLEALWSMLYAMSPYLLLGFFIAGLLYAFVPVNVTSRYLAFSGVRSVVWAALVGVPLPLCSCGVLPTAVSLRRSGASRAAATSFLIATPQTGVDSIAATWSMMGLPFAIVRPVAALVTAIFGGLAVGHFERNGQLDDLAADTAREPDSRPATFARRLVAALRYGFYEMVQNIGRWLIIGLLIAALITVLVPDDFFSRYAAYPLLNMLIIVAVAVPMYVCATGSIPIAAALMLKGLSPGCALVLLMAGPAANMASMMVLSKSFGVRATAVYVASIVLGAIGFGLAIDCTALRDVFTGALPGHACCSHHTGAAGLLSTLCSIALLAMLAVAVVGKYSKSFQLRHKQQPQMKTVKIRGMMCNHCKAAVERGLAELPGVTAVNVDLAQGVAYIEGTPSDKDIADKITQLGYQIV